MLTARGHDCIAAGRATIEGIEDRLDELLGVDGHAELRRPLTTVLTADQSACHPRPVLRSSASTATRQSASSPARSATFEVAVNNPTDGTDYNPTATPFT